MTIISPNKDKARNRYEWGVAIGLALMVAFVILTI